MAVNSNDEMIIIFTVCKFVIARFALLVFFFLVQENGVLKLRNREGDERFVRQISVANFLCFVSKLFSGLINSVRLLMPEVVHFGILPR